MSAATTPHATLRIMRMSQSMTKANVRAPGPAISRETSTPVTLSTTWPSCPSSGASIAASLRSITSVARLFRELLRAVLLLERIDELVQVAVHHIRQLVEREVDAMVRDASLRKVVGADALRTVAASHLQHAGLRLRGLLLLLFRGEQACLQQRHRTRAVLVLRALILALDHDAGRKVRDADSGFRLVHVLSAGARGAVRVDAQVHGID